MRLLALVPARGGSRGLPGKNLRPVDGISLVGRATICARLFLRHATGLTGDTLVDTDAEDIAAEGRAWGASVPFLRPPDLARDTTSSFDSVDHAVRRWEAERGQVDGIVLLQPTSPLRLPVDVSACVAAFQAGARSVITVVRAAPPPEFTMRMHQDGALEWAFGHPGVTRRQDAAVAWHPNGAVYVQSPDFLREHRTFVVAGITHGVEMPSDRSVDIDAAIDLLTAGAVARAARPAQPGKILSLSSARIPDIDMSSRDGIAGYYIVGTGTPVPGLAQVAEKVSRAGMLLVVENHRTSPASDIPGVIPALAASDPALGERLSDPARPTWVRLGDGASREELLGVAEQVRGESVTLVVAGRGAREASGVAGLAGMRIALGDAEPVGTDASAGAHFQIIPAPAG